MTLADNIMLLIAVITGPSAYVLAIVALSRIDKLKDRIRKLERRP
jgi:hypothetical protein